MKTLGMIALGVVVAASMSTTVLAEGAKAPKGEKHEAFKAADVNADGKLSLEEFKTMAKGPNAEKKFTAADTDKDGFLTPEELKAAHAAKKAARDAAKAVAPVAPEVPAAPAAPASPAK